MKRTALFSTLFVLTVLALSAGSALVANTKDQRARPTIVVHKMQVVFKQNGRMVDPNPNHLPNWAAAAGGGAQCMVYAPHTCQDTCASIVVTTNLGVKNTTPYPIAGPIDVVLQGVSGNTVRHWTLNGLAGNTTAYTGTVKEHFYCPPAGVSQIFQPNYVLVVTGPASITELDPNDDRAELYIRSTATISQ